jgi:hypothetical protein
MSTLADITHCKVKDGNSTFFWLDRWLLPETLATAFPALFSHHLKQHTLVSDIMHRGIQHGAASTELSNLLLLLQAVPLQQGQDCRKMLNNEPF